MRPSVDSGYVPYVDRVRFARKRKADSWSTLFLEGSLIFLALSLSYLVYTYTDKVHLQLTRFYANIGSHKAQQLMGQHLLTGSTEPEDVQEGVYWLEQAAKQGDPLAKYNLVISRMKGHSNIPLRRVKTLLKEASDLGVREAHRLLQECKIAGRCRWMDNKMDDATSENGV